LATKLKFAGQFWASSLTSKIPWYAIGIQGLFLQA